MSDILYVLQNKSIRLDTAQMDTKPLAGVVVPGHYEQTFLPDGINADKIFNSDLLLTDLPDAIAPGSSELIELILRDPRSQYLAERRIASRTLIKSSKKAQRWVRIGAFGNSFLISLITTNCLRLLTRIQPKSVLFDSTPHDIQSWIIGKASEYLHIPVVLCKFSPMHWRFGYCIGIDSQIWLQEKISEDESNADSRNKLERLVELNLKDYATATPSYMRAASSQQFSSRMKNFNVNGAIFRIISKGVRRIDLLRRIRKTSYPERRSGIYHAALDKASSYSEMGSACTQNIDLGHGKRFITLFLHYQWERTSLPEGGIFSQQAQAIIWLREWLPQDVMLYVKEHPMMLGKYTSNTLRPSGFYSFIASLNNVELVSPDIDSFDLIDASEMISTITGTVGFQALCRKTPVLAFGPANYLAHPAAFRVNSDMPDFTTIITRFNSEAPEFKPEYLKRYLSDLLPYTVGGDTEDDDLYSTGATSEAHRKAVSEFSLHWQRESFRESIKAPTDLS